MPEFATAMVIAAPEPKADMQPTVGEKRVVLHGVEWDAYLQIKDDEIEAVQVLKRSSKEFLGA